MRLILAIIGAVVGVNLGGGSDEILGLVVGALVGFILGELARLRKQLNELQGHLETSHSKAAQPPQPRVQEALAKPQAPQDVIATAPAPSAVQPVPQITSTRQAEPATPTTPVPPREPELIRLIREYFTGGNTLVRVGVVILFFGVAFLLRYVAERTQIAMEFRLAGVALGAIVLLVLGWRLRLRRAGYALALQGGGVGILYLTIFAALRLYALLPPTAAFALMVLIVAFSAALAVLQNSQALALLAVVGGFLAPILASTGKGSHVVLFSYYAILNAGILAIAWFKAWRLLNLAGFVFTFMIGIAWGVLRYRSELFASTEPFLVLFFLFYVGIAVLFATRQAPELRGYVDGTLVFGTPIVAFALQSAMLHERPYALAYSALVVGALYLVVAVALHRRHRSTQRLLVEAFMALGVAFLTLAVPLALDGRWSAATWALEGAALVWVGCRQSRRLPRAAGALLQIAAGVMFWRDVHAVYGKIPVLNSAYLGGLMVSVASIFSARILHRDRERLAPYEDGFAPLLFFWGLLWWLLAGFAEIGRHVPNLYTVSAAILFVTVTALLSSLLQKRFDMRFARWPALALLPALLLVAFAEVSELAHPFAQGGWLAWPLAFLGLYVILRRDEAPDAEETAQERAGRFGAGWLPALHVGSAWLLLALVTWELAWGIDFAVKGSGSWPAIAWGLLPAAMLFFLPFALRGNVWPFSTQRETYAVWVGGGVAVYLIGASLIANVSLRGDPYPLPYLPLFNPLDIAQAFVLLSLLRYGLHLRSVQYPSLRPINTNVLSGVLAGVTFIWLNAVLLRTLHHWAGVPFDLDVMLRSTLVQTSMSIFWTLLALATMLFGTRRSERAVWITGAVLLGVVIGKLFLVDLSRTGTVERIVSFVGVGLLTLVIGYFSPLPPVVAKEQR